MLVAGDCDEVNASTQISLWGGFIIGTVAWLYIIYEIFIGEANKINASEGTDATQKAFNALRIIVKCGQSNYCN